MGMFDEIKGKAEELLHGHADKVEELQRPGHRQGHGCCRQCDWRQVPDQIDAAGGKADGSSGSDPPLSRQRRAPDQNRSGARCRASACSPTPARSPTGDVARITRPTTAEGNLSGRQEMGARSPPLPGGVFGSAGGPPIPERGTATHRHPRCVSGRSARAQGGRRLTACRATRPVWRWCRGRVGRGAVQASPPGCVARRSRHQPARSRRRWWGAPYVTATVTMSPGARDRAPPGHGEMDETVVAGPTGQAGAYAESFWPSPGATSTSTSRPSWRRLPAHEMSS